MRTQTVAERVAHNEHAFREANERIERAAEEVAPEVELIPFICECCRASCTEITRLSRDEYARVREQSTTFLTVPGHEVETVEGVTVARTIERLERFSLMEKTGEAGEVAAQLVDAEGRA